jgi:murein DD-endopeptidase MepM/ murein hydrolase activator NlpD
MKKILLKTIFYLALVTTVLNGSDDLQITQTLPSPLQELNASVEVNATIVNHDNNLTRVSLLKEYTITRKYGFYVDPIFKIKLFNNSVSFRSKIKNAKVYNVFQGRVIYVKKDASSFCNVLKVKSGNKLTLVYSNLSKIAPAIKVGKTIEKGDVVGNVDNTLVFTVYKGFDSFNPLEVLKR